MKADEPVTVYTLKDSNLAKIIKMALRSERIACELDGERQAGLSEILEIGVLVRARDADRAYRIIERHELLQNNHPATQNKRSAAHVARQFAIDAPILIS